MAKILYTGFDLGYLNNSFLPSGWSVALSDTPRFINNPRTGQASILPKGLAYSGVLTFTCPALSGIRGCYNWQVNTPTSTLDLVSFGSVTLRINSTNQLIIRNNAVDVVTTAMSVAPTVYAYVPIEFSINLSTSGAATATFTFNGQTISWSAGTTTGATSTTLILDSYVTSGTGVSAGAIDDLAINDSTGSTDNGIPPLFIAHVRNPLAVAATNNFSVSGIRSCKVSRSANAVAAVRAPFATYIAADNVFATKSLPISSDTNPVTRQYLLTNATTDVLTDVNLSADDIQNSSAVLTSVVNSEHLVYSSNLGNSASIASLTNTRTGQALATLTSPSSGVYNVVSANNFLIYGASTTSILRFNPDGTTAGSFTTSTANGASNARIMHYSPVSDRVYCNVGSSATQFAVLNVTALTSTQISGVSSQTVTNGTGWIEDTANSRLYYVGRKTTDSSIEVINTSSNTFVKTITLTGKLAENVQSWRHSGGCLKTIAADFSNNRLFVATTGGEILSVNTSTDAVTSLTTVPVYSTSTAPLLARVGTKLLVFAFDRVVTINLSTNTVSATVLYPNVLQNGVISYAFRIYTDGTYYFVPQNYSLIYYDPSIDNFLAESDKLRIARNNLQALSDTTTANQVSNLRGNPTSAIQQNFTLNSNSLGATRILNVNVAASNSNKSGALSAAVQLGLKVGATEYQAGANITPSAAPNTDLVRPIQYKTGTTEFTPSEISSAEVYAKIV